MRQHSIIRTIYLYLFSLVGLTLLIIAGVRFLDMGLKVFIFTQADLDEKLMRMAPPQSPIQIKKVIEQDGQKKDQSSKSSYCLSNSEKALFDQWLIQYQNWQKQKENLNYLVAKRQREASLNLAMILIGLPLYLYHWRLIKKDREI